MKQGIPISVMASELRIQHTSNPVGNYDQILFGIKIRP